LTPERLAELLEALMSSPERLTEAARKAQAMGAIDAVARLADLVDELAGPKE
jgi:UDP-N-acetylglucosamine--N-acetylmuramyl-(pentapeptide) pyrophosphoryl-undecaprenol N-acetylglucosamine transferase